MKLSIIIPVYNEEATIFQILEKVESVKLSGNLTKEIILIDDKSMDSSAEIIEKYIASKSASKDLEIKFYKHEINSGKGAALQTGFKQATGDFLIIQDADLEYDPEDYNELLKPMLEHNADVVYGSRFKGAKPRRIVNWRHYVANKFLTMLSNFANNLYLTDMETCYKLFKTPIAKNLNLKERGFGIEPEITAKIAKVPNLRIYEVGISYYGRTYEEGKKITWKDGVKAVFYILKYKFYD